MDSEKSAETKSAQKASKMAEDLNRGNDVSTLGELDGLAALKAKMEAANRKTAEAKLAKMEEVKAPKAKSPKAKEESKVKAETKPKSEPKAKISKEDDLKLLNGVGPALAKKLAEAGYTSFEQISGLDKDGIAQMEASIGKPDIVSKNGWIDQIKELTS